MAVAVRDFRPGDEAAFRDINLAWIERFFAVEQKDRDVLDNPHKYILDPGGAILVAEDAGQTIGVVVNVPTSTMAREADLLLPTHAGPEIGVASTKAFTCQLAVLAALAAHMAVKKGRLSRDQEAEIVRHLLEAPAALNAALDHDEDIAAMAHLIYRSGVCVC